MPYGQSPGPPTDTAGGGDDNYSDGPSDTSDSSAPADDSQEESSEGETALLPKSILMGKPINVGDTIELKIVAVHGKEVQVQPLVDQDQDEDTGNEENPTAPSQVPPDAEMAGMMQ